MKIITIVGARPQFVKAEVVSREIEKHPDIKEIILHTGQHFDEKMFDVFFEEMQNPKPHYQLGINSLSHGAMTGQMLDEIEKVLLKEKPNFVLVYGDTNSTLAGALAAKKLKTKLALIASSKLNCKTENLVFENNYVFDKNNKDNKIAFNRLGGNEHWLPSQPDESSQNGLQEVVQWSPKELKPPNKNDQINGSLTYGFVFDVCELSFVLFPSVPL